jgi:import receptor subunit TOM22
MRLCRRSGRRTSWKAESDDALVERKRLSRGTNLLNALIAPHAQLPQLELLRRCETIQRTMVEITSAAASPASKVTVTDATRVARKLLLHTGKAMWILGTSLIVLAVPLIIEMDREQQLVEMENQQMGVLSGGASTSAPAATPSS